jgi:peptidoglycan/LPS O-acetylase OafA/YrhL
LAPDSQGQVLRPLRFPHVHSLDGIRGLAALAVVFHHCFSADIPSFLWSSPTRVVSAIASYCYLGVDLFFVLSGYLITSLLLLDRHHAGYYRNFYIKRAFRILPPLFLILLLIEPIFHFPWQTILLTLFFVANFSYTLGYPEIGPFWSLAIEEQFYLLWPTVVRHLRPRIMLRVLQALIVLTILLRLLGELIHHGNPHLTMLHCDGLAWGALLALLALRSRVPYRRHGNRLWRRFALPLLLCGAIGFAASLFNAFTRRPDFGLTLTSAELLFTALIAFLLTHPGHALTRFFSLRPIRYLGDVSYMLYLSHLYVLELYNRYFPGLFRHPTESALYLRFFAVLCISLIFCTLSLYLVERPIGRLRRYFLQPA